MATREVTCAASTLLAPLLGGDRAPLVEVARTRVSVHYEAVDRSVPVVSVCTPAAVRLPNSLVSSELPGPGSAEIGLGRLAMVSAGGAEWRVRRWWAPPRPAGLPRPHPEHLAHLAGTLDLASDDLPMPAPSYDALVPRALLGAGPGLTPAGDDVLAGALVTAHATADPRYPLWRRQTLLLLNPAQTTAVSRAMLRHAVDGYATPQLADLVTALCLGQDTDAAAKRLLAVGHSSGAALLHGVLHVLTTHPRRGVA